MDLLAELAEIGHVGELCRLAWVFDGPKRERLTEREFVDLIERTAGESFRYPRALPTLRTARHLGLVDRKGNHISLTPLGLHFRRLSGGARFSVSQGQGRLLLSLLLDDESLRRLIVAVLSSLRRDESGRTRLRRDAVEGPDASAIFKLLQQCGVFHYVGDALAVAEGSVEALPPSVYLPQRTTEAELLRRLEEQRLRGKAAEEFVVGLERDRLTGDGRADLAELVYRVSSDDVGAGYDISSFDSDGEARYVEVKSSVGRQLRFDWSAGERQRAEQLRSAYWIYFVPLADDLGVRPLPVVTICDPVSCLLSGTLVEEPSNFTVRAAGGRVIARKNGETLQDFSALV